MAQQLDCSSHSLPQTLTRTRRRVAWHARRAGGPASFHSDSMDRMKGTRETLTGKRCLRMRDWMSTVDGRRTRDALLSFANKRLFCLVASLSSSLLRSKSPSLFPAAAAVLVACPRASLPPFLPSLWWENERHTLTAFDQILFRMQIPLSLQPLERQPLLLLQQRPPFLSCVCRCDRT